MYVAAAYMRSIYLLPVDLAEEQGDIGASGA